MSNFYSSQVTPAAEFENLSVRGWFCKTEEGEGPAAVGPGGVRQMLPGVPPLLTSVAHVLFTVSFFFSPLTSSSLSLLTRRNISFQRLH